MSRKPYHGTENVIGGTEHFLKNVISAMGCAGIVAPLSGTVYSDGAGHAVSTAFMSIGIMWKRNCTAEIPARRKGLNLSAYKEIPVGARWRASLCGMA